MRQAVKKIERLISNQEIKIQLIFKKLKQTLRTFLMVLIFQPNSFWAKFTGSLKVIFIISLYYVYTLINTLHKNAGFLEK